MINPYQYLTHITLPEEEPMIDLDKMVREFEDGLTKRRPTKSLAPSRGRVPVPTLDDLVAMKYPKRPKTDHAPQKGTLTSMIDLAKEVGFDTSAKLAQSQYELLNNEAQAEEFYEHVTLGQIQIFNQTLRKTTERAVNDWEVSSVYQTLVRVDLSQYREMPPTDVLLKIKEAKDRRLFHSFEIAYITEHRVRKPDPIAFGRINGSDKLFMIAQWGDDVNLSDILAAK